MDKTILDEEEQEDQVNIEDISTKRQNISKAENKEEIDSKENERKDKYNQKDIVDNNNQQNSNNKSSKINIHKTSQEVDDDYLSYYSQKIENGHYPNYKNKGSNKRNSKSKKGFLNLSIAEDSFIDNTHQYRNSLNNNVSFKAFFINLFKNMKLENANQYIIILVLSITLTIVLQFLNFLLTILFDARLTFCSKYPFPASWLLWILSSIGILVLATLPGHFISKHVDGSGIPEIKSILSGTNIDNYLSSEAMLGKILATLFAIVGGASIGRVGPFVHISACICNLLLKLNCFKSLNNKNTKVCMISASAAAGISLALGTPLGAAVFSIEATASVYNISYLTKALLCSVICSIISNVIEVSKYSDLFAFTSKKETLNLAEYGFIDIIFFLLIGLSSGLLSAILNTIIAKITHYRKKVNIAYLRNKFLYMIVFGFVISNLSFMFPPLMQDDRRLLKIIFEKDDFNITGIRQELKEIKDRENMNNSYYNKNISDYTFSELEEYEDMINKKDINNSLHYFSDITDITGINPFTTATEKIDPEKLDKNHSLLSLSVYNNNGFYLFFLLIIKIIITIISLSMNIPAGMFAPFFLIGGLLGRLIGHILNILFQDAVVSESLYSIVGAACLMSGATHTISASIIIFELTGKTHFLPLMLVCNIISNLASQSLSVSFFDVFMMMKNLPYLPSIKASDLYSKSVKEIMLKETFKIYYSRMSLINCLELLMILPKSYDCVIPVLSDNDYILFTIKPSKLLSTISEKVKLNLVDEVYYSKHTDKNNEDNSSEQVDKKITKTDLEALTFIIDYLEVKFSKSSFTTGIELKFTNYNMLLDDQGNMIPRNQHGSNFLFIKENNLNENYEVNRQINEYVSDSNPSFSSIPVSSTTSTNSNIQDKDKIYTDNELKDTINKIDLLSHDYDKNDIVKNIKKDAHKSNCDFNNPQNEENKENYNNNNSYISSNEDKNKDEATPKLPVDIINKNNLSYLNNNEVNKKNISTGKSNLIIADIQSNSSLNRKQKLYLQLKRFLKKLRTNTKQLTSPLEQEKLRQANRLLNAQVEHILYSLKTKNILELKKRIIQYESISKRKRSAYTVETCVSIINIHFLFTFLSNVFVVEKSRLVGNITKEHFITMCLEEENKEI